MVDDQEYCQHVVHPVPVRLMDIILKRRKEIAAKKNVNEENVLVLTWTNAMENFTEALKILTVAPDPRCLHSYVEEMQKHSKFVKNLDDFEALFPVWYLVEKLLCNKILMNNQVYSESHWSNEIGMVLNAHKVAASIQKGSFYPSALIRIADLGPAAPSASLRRTPTSNLCCLIPLQTNTHIEYALSNDAGSPLHWPSCRLCRPPLPSRPNLGPATRSHGECTFLGSPRSILSTQYPSCARASCVWARRCRAILDSLPLLYYFDQSQVTDATEQWAV
ncbi:hypothetical protein B0H14DRAFT_3429311 [Mycena olivaceomarginata]|nr:hypothetical protein B0H14DRAFT_3429311 [Mycena olivaceomarginata]